MMGTGQFVLERGNQFAASIVSNNKVRVLDGDALMQGRHIRLKENTYVDLNFDNGTQGYSRIDLIAIRYTKDSATDIETANLIVIKGTPAESNPVVPDYVSGDIINEHDLTNDLVLYQVPFNGLNIQPLVQVFDTVSTWETLKNQTIAEVKKQVNDMVEQAEQDVAEAIGELVKIHVTTDDQLIGQTLTISNGSKSFAAIVPDEKEVTFTVPTVGVWTIHNPVTNIDTEVKTQFYGIYDVEVMCYRKFSAILDFSMSNPDTMCTYADDAEGMTEGGDDWENQTIFKDLRNCILNDGKVLGYLNKKNLVQYEDGTTADITTLGNDVMLEIPYRVGYMIKWLDSTKLKVSVTDNPNDADYEYDAFSLDSYNDCDKIYIGTYKGYASGSKVYSSSGKAVTVSQTIDTFRTYCRARGTGYQQRTWGSLKLMQCLYIIRFGTLNSQAAVGYGYVNSSHSAGVSTGGTNSYGFNSEVIKASNPTYMTDQNHQVKCLGIEDFWGNYWEFIDGLFSGTAREILTCTCAKDFSTTGVGYDNQGNGGVSADLGNYMSRPQGGNKAGFTPQTVAGSDSTYFCDSAYLRVSCRAIFGGGWAYASATGAFRLSLDNASSLSSASVGCRLMYMHKEEKEENAA
jgi:hypothetical protein